ncbi:hypothetical protein [Microtetraspora niveoalba]|uniref:hypothetical protein n=1 Tax=Microtetraspora niveoalba TaxID=46175 RepID=UPI00082D437B|nr:hypothetical protein [Microtetraspora niveoalba]
MAASVLGLAGAAAIVVPSISAGASTAELVVDYACKGGIAATGSGTVNLRTKVTIPTTLNVGEPLNIGWKLNYKDVTRFGAPALLPQGGKIEVTGNIQLQDAWIGVLKPMGAVDQPEAMVKGSPLKLPEGISDFAHTDRAGTVKVTPRKLFVDFRPPASEVMVNDDDPAILYSDGWEDLNDQPSQNKDHHLDLHRTTSGGKWAQFTFTGTGVEYVAQKDQRAGPVDILIDGQPASPPRIDPSKNDDGTTVNDANKGGQTLWRFRGLPYAEHKIEVRSVEDGKWTQLDAFRVITRELAHPPKEYRAECDLVSAPVSVNVTIGDGATEEPSTGTSPSPDPSDSTGPSTSASPTPSDTGGNTHIPVSPTPTPSSSPTGTRNGSTPTPTETKLTSVIVLGSPTPTATATTTITLPASTPTSPQVKVIPKGGAQTGEAPETSRASAAVLIGSGGVMVFGGVFSGVVLLRRRAAHANDRSRMV